MIKSGYMEEKCLKSLIIIFSKMMYWIGKIFGKGTSFPGKVALQLDPNILKKVTLPDNIIMVTGSNGKTSTTEMIYQVLKDNGFSVDCNIEGSNQIEGIATLILKNSNLSGIVKKDVLVIEADERYVRKVLKNFKPRYLVVTNLYRDQMTRNGHPEHVYHIIDEAITSDIRLVLNTDDPISSLLGYQKENVIYFGINKNALSQTQNDSRYDDGKYCMHCKGKLKYEYYHFNHIGSYYCKKCGHSRKNPNYAITDIDLTAGKITINKKHRIDMTMHSMYHAYNLLATFAVARVFGIEEKKIVTSLSNYIVKNDRVQSFELNGHEAMLLTSKHENPVSYNQSLIYVSSQKEDCTVVIIIDSISRKYFTNETSWIWDIDFEKLSVSFVKKVILAGRYANDLAARFNYSIVDMGKVKKITDLNEMMKEVKENAEGKIYVITCFSDRMKFLDRR